MQIPRRVLITGARGFIGQHVVQYFLDRGVEKIVAMGGRFSTEMPGRNPDPRIEYIHGDLSQSQFVKHILQTRPVEAIIHLAANPIVRLDEKTPPNEIIDTNITTTHNLLAYASENCVFINASSATVYGHTVLRIIGGVREYEKIQPNTVYAATKAASEHLVDAYKTLGRVRGVNLRLVANVGAGATHGVVKDIIAKLRSDNPNLELLGDYPGSEKPFVHVNDTAQAFWLAATNPEWLNHKAVNISSEDTMTVEDLAYNVMNSLFLYKPIVWLGEKANWKGDNRLVLVDANKALSLGWKPLFPKSHQAVHQAVLDIYSLEQSECQKVF